MTRQREPAALPRRRPARSLPGTLARLQNLENLWKTQKDVDPRNFAYKNLFVFNEAKTRPPNFSKFFLGRFGPFQWVAAKKTLKF